MSFNFDELLHQGKDAAENVLKRRKEIKVVLGELEVSLSKFLDTPVELQEYVEYADESQTFGRVANPFRPREKTGFNVVRVVSKEVECSRDVFRLKRDEEVYPLTIAREHAQSVAYDQSEFAAEVGEIVSKPDFHLQLNAFRGSLVKKLKEQEEAEKSG